MPNKDAKQSKVSPSKSTGAEANRDTDASFETVITRLETVVDKLETGNLSLEESIETFEEGIRLSRVGTKRLEEAEHRVEMLLSEREGHDQGEMNQPKKADESG